MIRNIVGFRLVGMIKGKLFYEVLIDVWIYVNYFGVN